MNYFLDTEFSKLPWEEGCYLISLALISENGKGYTACLEDIDLSNVSDFVKQNVIPYLPPQQDRKSRKEISSSIERIIGKDEEPIVWAIFPQKSFLTRVGLSGELVDEYYEKYCDFDFQLFRELWEEENYPKNFPTECKNLTDLLVQLPKDRLPPNIKAHDCLSDALWALEVWKMAQTELS